VKDWFMSETEDRFNALLKKHPEVQKVVDDPAVKKAVDHIEYSEREDLTVPEEMWKKYNVPRGQTIPPDKMAVGSNYSS
jgi:hypothetical protein